ncbi:MAG TPA: hypothetical protein VG328_04310 [Stellaceae bacterium]|nr:hypothetical protein [Stellaceae bacterium]
MGKIINPLANAANGLIQDAKTGLDQATNLATDLGHQVVQDVSAVADTVAANLPDASSLVDDIGRSGPLNSPSYVNGSGGPSGDGNASAGDSEFVTGYKDDLLSRAARIKALAEKFYKVSEDLDSKGHHWLWSNDTDVLASAKTINDMAKALAILASEIDSWSNSPNKDAIKKGSDAAKYVGYLLNAADFVVAAKDMELSIDNLNASKGEATVNAWADSMGNLFDKAGGLIDLIPDGAVPGFMKDYWKGLFSAPKNYIAAFKTIMKEHYDIVNEEGHVNTGDGQQAYNLGMAQTEWRGALTGIYVGAFTLPKNTAGQTLQEFMRKHQDEDGLDLYKAPLQAGKETLCHRIEANLAGDDPALEAWLSYVRKN